MLNSVKLHSDYGQREKRKLRRKARQAVPEVATTAPAGHLVQTGAGVELRRIDTAATGYAGDFVRVVVNRHAEDVARTAAHETRHIAQDKGTRSDYDTAENDADTYAEEAMQRLWPAVKEELPERAA